MPRLPVRAETGRVLRVIWMAWAACGNSIPAAIVTTLSERISAAVRGGSAAVHGLDLAPRERGELAAQPGLVALHREHPVRAAGVQVIDVVALRVECVGREHHAGEVDAAQRVEQRRERGGLVGSALDLHLAQHDAGVLVDHREQMSPRHSDPVRAGVSRTAHGLAVHGEHPAPPGRCRGCAQALDERANHGIESVGVHLAEQSADGRLRRAPVSYPERGGDLDGQVSDPLGGRDERACPGRDRAG